MFRKFTSRQLIQSKLFKNSSLIKYNFNSTNEKKIETDDFIQNQKNEKNENLNQNQPKWMKFFSGNEPLKIDLERSLKTENQDMLINYIKSNYTSLNLEQLILTLPKLQKTGFFYKIWNEIKLRLVSGQKIEKNQQLFDLLNNIKDFENKDQFLIRFMYKEFTQKFNQFDHIQQTQILKFMFFQNKVQSNIINQYLEFYKQAAFDTQAQTKFILGLKFEELCDQIQILDDLFKIIPEKEFQTLIPNEYIECLIDQYSKHLIDTNDLEIMNQICFTDNDKILPDQLPMYLTPQQRIKIKKTFNHFLMQKYYHDQNFGKFIQLRSEKYTFSILSQVFDQQDRYLIENSFNQISNYILKNNTQKFDFQLFPYMIKFKIVNKNYIDEGLINTGRLVKNINFASKQALYSNINHHQNVNTINRWKAFNQLNYEDILLQNEDSEYIKEIWKDTKIEINDYIHDYLQIIANDFQEHGQFYQNIKTTMKLNNLQEEEDNKNKQHEIDQNSQNNENSESIEDFDQTVDNKTLNLDQDQELQENVENNINANTTKLLNKNDDQLNQEKIIMNELKQFIQQEKLFKPKVFQKKYSYQEISNIKLYINIVEALPFFVSANHDYQTSMDLVKEVMSNSDINKIFLDRFLYIPSFLENLIIITQIFKYKSYNPCLNEYENQIVYDTKQKIDDFLNENLQDPVKFIKKINNFFEEQDIIPLDKSFFIDSFNNYMFNQNYLANKKEYAKTINRLKQEKDNIFVPQYENDFFNEKYIDNQTNFYKKILHSELMKYILKESQLKRVCERSLIKNKIQFQKNFVDYPFYADFLITKGEEKTIFKKILDQDKLVLGARNVLIGYFKLAEQYFKILGYKVKLIEYMDYEYVDEKLIKNILG